MSPKYHVKWIGDDALTRVEHFYLLSRAEAFRDMLINEYEFNCVWVTESKDSVDIITKVNREYQSLGSKTLPVMVKKRRLVRKSTPYSRACRSLGVSV